MQDLEARRGGWRQQYRLTDNGYARKLQSEKFRSEKVQSQRIQNKKIQNENFQNEKFQNSNSNLKTSKFENL